MSVDVLPFIIADGHDPGEWVTTPRWIGSVKFEAKFLRDRQLQVGYDPIEASQNHPGNPYHGSVWGEFTRRVICELQAGAAWFVAIPDVELT